MARTRLAFIVALSLLSRPPEYVFALDITLDTTQYAHKAWKIRDGFTDGYTESIAQTPDGYLWLGTEFGLIRFDGIHHVVWTPSAGQNLPSSRIRALLAARDGSLWIGTDFSRIMKARSGRVGIRFQPAESARFGNSAFDVMDKTAPSVSDQFRCTRTAREAYG
jgi:Two component regulator propeller